MTIRDLGYRPYEGERLPPSHNTWVLLRHGLRRGWSSLLVKIATFAAWLPPVIAAVVVAGTWYFSRNAPPGTELGPPSASVLTGLFWWQFWLFVTLITLGAGAGAIAEDLRYKAFQFYFAKPVTPPQYLVGRVVAVGFYCLMVTLLPALLVVVTQVATAPEDLRLERLGLVLPALFYSLIVSVVAAAGAIGISALSQSRALTMSAWLLLLLIPSALAWLVFRISEWPWLYLLSIPALLDVVGNALFKVEPDSALRWYHAAPILCCVVGGGLWFAYRRIRSAEVIT